MTTIAVMQPTYLPWAGYFDLADQVDAFVLLDTVQFAKRSWQQRNRIRTRDGLSWLTVPVQSRGRYDQSIAEVEIADSRFVDKHLRTLEHHYNSAPGYDEHGPNIEHAMRIGAETGRLSVLNERLIYVVARSLGITTPIVRASALDVTGSRSELLCRICRSLDATNYLSPMGSLDYLIEDRRIFEQHGIHVWLQQYEHPVWAQRYAPFAAYSSAVDLLFNGDDDALGILRSGRRAPRSLYDYAPQPQAKQVA